MRKRPRTDENHGAIVTALRNAGCAVQSLASVGSGCPDLLVSRNGHCCVAEVKDGDKAPSKQKLTDDQEAWVKSWKSPVFVLRSVDDAIRLSNAMV